MNHFTESAAPCYLAHTTWFSTHHIFTKTSLPQHTFSAIVLEYMYGTIFSEQSSFLSDEETNWQSVNTVSVMSVLLPLKMNSRSVDIRCLQKLW